MTAAWTFDILLVIVGIVGVQAFADPAWATTHSDWVASCLDADTNTAHVLLQVAAHVKPKGAVRSGIASNQAGNVTQAAEQDDKQPEAHVTGSLWHRIPQFLHGASLSTALSGEVSTVGLAQRFQATSTEAIGVAIVAWLLVVAPMMCFACCYHGMKSSIMSCIGPGDKPNRVAFDQKLWSVGLFRCCDWPGFCIFNCCCGGVRWADTLAMAGILTYYCAVISFMAIMQVFSATGLWLLHITFFAFYRQKLRQRFGIPNGDCSTWMSDLCAYGFCMPCAVTQEARHVEMAAQLGILKPPRGSRSQRSGASSSRAPLAAPAQQTLPPEHSQQFWFSSTRQAAAPPTAVPTPTPAAPTPPARGSWMSKLDEELNRRG